jgi:predicted nucleotidyltransferase
VTAAEALAEHRAEIRAIVEANRATNPRVFGSVARGEDHQGSDLDLLVDGLPGMTLLSLGRMITELQRLLDIKVDVVESGAGTARFQADVLAEAVPL